MINIIVYFANHCKTKFWQVSKIWLRNKDVIKLSIDNYDKLMLNTSKAAFETLNDQNYWNIHGYLKKPINIVMISSSYFK